MLCLEPNTLFLSLLYPQTQILLSQFHLQLFFLCHWGFRFFSSQHGSAQISVLFPQCLSCIVTCFSSLLYSQVWVSSALSHGGVGNGLSSRGRGAGKWVPQAIKHCSNYLSIKVTSFSFPQPCSCFMLLSLLPVSNSILKSFTFVSQHLFILRHHCIYATFAYFICGTYSYPTAGFMIDYLYITHNC